MYPDQVTFKFEKQPTGQWLGTSPEFSLLIAERTLTEAIEQTAIVLRAIETTPAHCNGGYARSFDEPCACGARGKEACRATFR